ncbi:MAG: hypothetical protein KTR28_08585 [Micavibrio sp.]|nr:hypothetical protein [Micavibrio sp.]
MDKIKSEEIKERLQTCSQNCLEAYQNWEANKKDSGAKAALQEAIHELRKVSSRVEIELAISDRDESSKKQIPIPAHRDARSRTHDDGDDNAGNSSDSNQGRGGPKGGQNRGGGSRRRGPSKKTSGDN